jgi:hypothetical protein
LAVDSQATPSDQRRRVAAAGVRTNEAFEHVRDTVSVGVGASAADPRVAFEPGDLFTAKFSNEDCAPVLKLCRRA